MNQLNLAIVTLFTLLLASCSMQRTNCPNLAAGHHISKPYYTHAAHSKNKNKQEEVRTNAGNDRESLTTSSNQKIVLPKRNLMEFALPASFKENLNAVGIDNLNSELRKYSAHMRVEQRGDRSFVKVSPTEMLRVARKIIRADAQEKKKVEESHGREVVALIGGILGIVSIGLSPIPILNLFGIFTGIAAVILGSIALRRSGKRRRWAIIAIVLGVIGFIISIIWFYISWFFVLGLA